MDISLPVFIAFGIGLVLGFGIVRQMRARAARGRGISSSALNEKEKKIVARIREYGRVQNDDIQQLLGVSDATATRYLSALEEKGVVRQRGSGRGIYYDTP